MRVVAGPDGSKTFQQAELDRHADALLRFGEQAGNTAIRHKVCTLILRSPASAPAQALMTTQTALADAGIRARVILAKLEPEQHLRELCATLAVLGPGTDRGALIRWARNPRLWDAHEQAAYGPDMCWSGDPIRRDADKRNPLALFETAADAALRAAHAFKALWGACVPVPAHLFNAGPRTTRARTPEGATDSTVTAPRPIAEVWPLVRH